MASAGIPLGVALEGANGIAFAHSLGNRNQYSNREMSVNYVSLPSANTANIIAGYDVAKTGTLCHK
jgi:hypothetical protein